MDCSDSSVRAKQLQPRDREFVKLPEVPQLLEPKGVVLPCEGAEEEGVGREDSALGSLYFW